MQNLKRHVNVITLRSKIELEDADEENNKSKKSVKNQPTCEVVKKEKEEPYAPPPPYKRHIQFPQRIAKTKM